MNLRNAADVHDNRQTFRMETGQTAYKRKLAYRRLGIHPKEVECVPYFAMQLRQIARCVNRRARNASSSPHIRPLDLLGCSEDPEASRVVDVYLAVPESYRRLLRPEVFCHAAGVPPWRILEIITGIAVRMETQACAIMAAIVHLSVLEKTITRALQDDGEKERMVLHKAVGYI
jgi:hypothetical protein